MINSLLLKNYYLYRKKPIRNLFTLLLPVILVYLLISIGELDKESSSNEVIEYHDEKFITNLVFSYDKYDKNYNFLENDEYEEKNYDISIQDSFALISSNSTFINNLILFLEIDSINRYLCKLKDCQIFTFNTFKDYIEYASSDDFQKSNTTFSVIIEFLTEESFKLHINKQYSNSYQIIDDITITSLMNQDFYQNLELKIYKILTLFVNRNKNSMKNLLVEFFPAKENLHSNKSFSIINQIQQMLLPYLITIGFFSIMFSYYILIVEEKLNKQLFLLKRHNINTFNYNLSWVITYAVQVIPVSIFISLLLHSYILINTNFMIILVPIILFNLSLSSFSLFLSLFVKSKDSGRMIINIVFILTTILSLAISSLTEIKSDFIYKILEYVLFLLPQISFNKSLDQLMFTKNEGINSFNDIFLYYKGSNFILNCFILLVDFLIFFFLSVFLSRDKKAIVKENKIISSQPSEENDSLIINNITKTYEGKTTPAVNEFILEIKKNQIFVLLGHNGAGKSSLINILAGDISADSGYAYINGVSLLERNENISNIISFTSQENIFFDGLTVMENLIILSKLKQSLDLDQFTN